MRLVSSSALDEQYVGSSGYQDSDCFFVFFGFTQEDLEEIDIQGGEDQLDEEAREALVKYQKETDALAKAVDKIHEKIETIESRYQISLSEYVDDADKAIASNDIARLLDQTEKTSEAIRKRLRRIAGENKLFAAEYPNKTGELRVRINTHTGVTRRFMDAMQLFEESQEKHRDSVKSSLERHLRMMNPQATADDIQEALRNGATDSIVDDSPILADLPLEEQSRLRRGLADLKGRNNDIKKLEESIIHLHQLFVDMQILVEAQGELLNDIEYNIGETKGKTEAGFQELVQARAHQKSAHRKKICIAILVIIVLAVVLIPILIKFIPKWFPSTQETIDNLPIIGSGGSGNSTNTNEADPPGATEPPGYVQGQRISKHVKVRYTGYVYEIGGRAREVGKPYTNRRPSDAAELLDMALSKRLHVRSHRNGDIYSTEREMKSDKVSRHGYRVSVIRTVGDIMKMMIPVMERQGGFIFEETLKNSKYYHRAVEATDLCAVGPSV